VSGEALDRADAAFIAYFDPRLLEFEEIWAAAGTPNHMFNIAPQRLADAIGATIAGFTE